MALIAVIGGCAAPPKTVSGTGVTAPMPPMPSLGAQTPVRDGAMEFLVLDLTRARQAGDPHDPATSLNAHGVFLVATISVRNTGGTPLTFVDGDQELIDRTGRVFPVDRAADIYGNRGLRSTKINPGDSLVVHLFFDVPPDTAAKNLLLHESDSSPGVTVGLS